jgi:hypothetical protein
LARINDILEIKAKTNTLFFLCRRAMGWGREARERSDYTSSTHLISRYRNQFEVSYVSI